MIEVLYKTLVQIIHTLTKINKKNQAKSFVLMNVLFPVPNVFSIMSSLLFAFKFLYAS